MHGSGKTRAANQTSGGEVREALRGGPSPCASSLCSALPLVAWGTVSSRSETRGHAVPVRGSCASRQLVGRLFESCALQRPLPQDGQGRLTCLGAFRNILVANRQADVPWLPQTPPQSCVSPQKFVRASESLVALPARDILYQIFYLSCFK